MYRDVYTGIHTVVAASVEFSAGEAFCANMHVNVYCVCTRVYVSKRGEGVRPFGLWLCGEFGEGVERSVDKGGYLVDWGKNSTRFWTFFPFPSHRKIVEKLTKSEIEILYLHVPCKYFNISSEFSERRGDPWIVKDVEKRKITTSLFSRTVGHRRAKTRASRERNPG